MLGFDEALATKAFRKKGNLFLVEGPRDALRLLQHGIPAIAILGANNWSKYRIELLQEAEPEKIFILFDNDKPGIVAARKIHSSIKMFMPTKILKLPSMEKNGGIKLDPANMPIEIVKKLKRY